jgi:hypothetical protein
MPVGEELKFKFLYILLKNGANRRRGLKKLEKARYDWKIQVRR